MSVWSPAGFGSAVDQALASFDELERNQPTDGDAEDTFVPTHLVDCRDGDRFGIGAFSQASVDHLIENHRKTCDADGGCPAEEVMGVPHVSLVMQVQIAPGIFIPWSGPMDPEIAIEAAAHLVAAAIRATRER